MLSTPQKIITSLVLPSYLIVSGCSTLSLSKKASATSISSETAPINDNYKKYAIGSASYGDPNSVELIADNRDPSSIPEPELMGPAQVLATDSKYFARAYGIEHTEAMRRMLIQHDNQEQKDAIHAEFGDRIAGTSIIDEPEYGILVTLTGNSPPPPDRILYRPADKLNERETVAKSYQTMGAEGITLTQAELDKAMALIESPTRFIVKFEVNPKAKNLTEAQTQFMYERSKELNKRIPMMTGSAYRSDEGLLKIYVHADDAKAAGLTKQKLKQIGEEVMKMPVRIE